LTVEISEIGTGRASSTDYSICIRRPRVQIGGGIQKNCKRCSDNSPV